MRELVDHTADLEVSIDACSWRIPRSYRHGMLVDGIVFADQQLASRLRDDVACLPGVQVASLAMPDIHQGYGFCIGGVCATDPEDGGVISPGGVGYDINCAACGSSAPRSTRRWCGPWRRGSSAG